MIQARLPEPRLEAVGVVGRLLPDLRHQPLILLIPEPGHPIGARRYPHEIEADLREDVDVVRGIEVEEVAERGHVHVAILEFGAQILPRVLADPELQQVAGRRGGDAADHLPRLRAVFLERDPAAVREADVALRLRDEDRDAVAHRLLGRLDRLPALRLRGAGGPLDVRRVAVELRVFEAAGAGVVEDHEVALVDVLAEPRAPALHLLVEDRALQRAREGDVLHVRRIEARGEQIHGHRRPRPGAADFCEVPFELMRVPLRTGDARRVVGVAGEAAQLGRHEGGVRIVDAEDDRLLVAKLVLPEQMP